MLFMDINIQNIREFNEYKYIITIYAYFLSFASLKENADISYLITVIQYVRFDISTVVTMKNAVFWDVSPVQFTRSTRRHIPEDGLVQL
jgi:hypothetical protein